MNATPHRIIRTAPGHGVRVGVVPARTHLALSPVRSTRGREPEQWSPVGSAVVVPVEHAREVALAIEHVVAEIERKCAGETDAA